MSRTPKEIVEQEVLVNVTGMVQLIASTDTGTGGYDRTEIEMIGGAQEVIGGKVNFEDAAIEAGWTYDRLGEVWKHPSIKDISGRPYLAVDAEDACQESNVEPHYNEVYECWAVTERLGELLESHGENVQDIGGTTVWGRTTTGQAIWMDDVIQKIAADIERRYQEWENE